MFINLSNHPHKKWSEKQKKAALRYGEIADYPFPAVDPTASVETVEAIADKLAEDIISKKPDAVMCQGEFTLTFAVVCRLQAADILTLCACSKRQTIEKTDKFGRTTKETLFEFVQFRPYGRRKEQYI